MCLNSSMNSEQSVERIKNRKHPIRIEKCPKTFAFGERKAEPLSKIFAFVEDKTGAPRQISTFGEDKTGPQTFFAFGEITAATNSTPAAPERCGDKKPCCGKPHIASGECCGKHPFRQLTMLHQRNSATAI